MTMRSVAYVGTAVLLGHVLLTQGCGGGNDPATNQGQGGATVPAGTGGATTPAVTGQGGATVPAGNGGATTPAVTGQGGATTTALGGATTAGTGGVTGAAGSTGSNPYTPSCTGLGTAAGVDPTKNGICLDTDPQLCYKTCGPQSIGFKSETCTAGVYVEQSGCSFLPGDYSCYKIPTAISSACPTEVPQANTVCTVATCTLCNVNNGYLDSGGAAKTGYCVCPPPSTTTGVSKWSCASSTAWPCPAGQGC
jgi:hypothetical protein